MNRKKSISRPFRDQLIITDAKVVTMDSQRHNLPSGTIIIQDGEIKAVLSSEKYREQHEDGSQHQGSRRIIPASGMIAIPGLINSHTHVSEILLRGGICQDRGLYDWQWNVTYPAIRAYTEQDAYIAALLYSVDTLKAGTTTLVDNANTAFDLTLTNAALKAYEFTGIRAVLARVFATGPLEDDRLLRLARLVQGPQCHMLPSETLESLKEVRSTLEPLMKSYNTNRESKIHIWPAPHKPNRTAIGAIEMSYELAYRYDAMVSQPCAEVQAESEVNGLDSVEFLDSCGLLCERSLLGHCVYIAEQSIRKIKARDARIAHLPIANLYLGSGVAPIPKILRTGITVALGTDNANCNDSVSMFREMAVAALIHKGVNLDAAILTSDQVFEMATIGAARAIGEDGRIGSIEKGKRADIVLIDANKTHLTPLHNVVGGLVYQANGSEVDTVIVDGEMLVKGGVVTFMTPQEEAELRREAQHRSAELLVSAGLSLSTEGIDSK